MSNVKKRTSIKNPLAFSFIYSLILTKDSYSVKSSQRIKLNWINYFIKQIKIWRRNKITKKFKCIHTIKKSRTTALAVLNDNKQAKEAKQDLGNRVGFIADKLEDDTLFKADSKLNIQNCGFNLYMPILFGTL